MPGLPLDQRKDQQLGAAFLQLVSSHICMYTTYMEPVGQTSWSAADVLVGLSP
jgi:hypothetical protein